MFAGPNGSGKSGLIHALRQRSIPLGSLVDADQIAQKLYNLGFIDFKEYQLKNITQETWESSLHTIPEIRSRLDRIGEIPNVQIKENTLVLKTLHVDGYSGALISDFIRYMLLEQGLNFSFETVMSHESKISFLREANQKGYITYLYYIATDNPDINISRIRNRVKKGGHDVDSQKVIDRYYKSIRLLKEALTVSKRAFVLDNSQKNSSIIILEKEYDGYGYLKVENPPNWFAKNVLGF